MIDDEKAFKPLYSGLRKVINVDTFLAQSIYLPPIEEQREIVKKIEAFIVESKKAEMVYQEEIALLKEAKTNISLKTISGQIDTRNIVIPEYEYCEDLEETDEEYDFIDGEEE